MFNLLHISICRYSHTPNEEHQMQMVEEKIQLEHQIQMVKEQKNQENKDLMTK